MADQGTLPQAFGQVGPSYSDRATSIAEDQLVMDDLSATREAPSADQADPDLAPDRYDGLAPQSTQEARAELFAYTGRRRQDGTAMSLTTKVTLGAVAILAALTVLGSVLTVGDHLMSASGVLGVVFYLLVGVVVAVGIIYPVICVAKRPIFSLYQLRDEQGHAKRRHCRMLVDNLKNNLDLTDDQIAEVEGYLEEGDKADDLIIDFFERTCVPAIDQETKRAATTAFLATAISHSALVDTVTMLSICLDLVRSIVERCGFRPTNLGLARLYSRVMISALVAGGLDDADLDGLIGSVLGGGTGGRVSGILLGSATSGLVSAFLVFRVGVITKHWLCAEDGPAKMAELRRGSYREALSMMRTSGFTKSVSEVLRRNASSMASSVASSVKGAATTAATTMGNAVGSAVGGIAESVGSTMGGMATSVGNAAASMGEAALSTAGSVASAASQVVTSIADTTSHAARAATDAADGLAKRALSGLGTVAHAIQDTTAGALEAVGGLGRHVLGRGGQHRLPASNDDAAGDGQLGNDKVGHHFEEDASPADYDVSPEAPTSGHYQ